MKELKEYLEEVFADYNDINDDTRVQLDLINQTLAELQAKDRGFNVRERIEFKLPEGDRGDVLDKIVAVKTAANA